MIFSEDSPDGKRCRAETSTGQRCKRKAKTVFKDEVDERFLLFFKKRAVYFFYYCNQHADKAMRGQRIV